jgi:hypothetical protein
VTPAEPTDPIHHEVPYRRTPRPPRRHRPRPRGGERRSSD